MLAVNGSANHRIIHICSIIGYAPYWHFPKTGHITFTLHIYYLTFMWKDEGDGGGVRGDKGVKPVSASFRLHIIVAGEKNQS